VKPHVAVSDVLSLTLVSCGLFDTSPERARINPCPQELADLENFACATFSLSPPVDLERTTFCMCGHLKLRFVDSSESRFEVSYCNRIASYSLGSPDKALFTLGDCHGSDVPIQLS
jgi:hypothetical protein